LVGIKGVFITAFNNIPVISWQLDLLVEKTGLSDWPAASNFQTITNVSNTPHNRWKLNLLTII
jgi:hypothetical protein